MPVRLTETAIHKAAREAEESRQRREIADLACAGLRLRLTPTGTKSWVLACRDRQGRMRRFPLGNFPGMGVAEARHAARALHGRVKQDGADPVADRRRERVMGAAAKAGVGTLAAILDIYTEKRGKSLKSWGEAYKRIKLVFKPLLARAITTLTSADFQVVADGYPKEMSAAFAVRSLRPALKWAAQRGHLRSDVAAIYAPAAVKRRKRVLAPEELAKLLPVLRSSPRPYAAALRFMLLTLARREEVGGARRSDVDLQSGQWTILETKNGERHIVPLSRQALELLRAITTGDANTADLIFATQSGARLRNWDRETKAIQEASDTKGWTRHDLRRTGATMLGDMGELPDIIEAALNHVAIRSPLAATYNRSRYRPQVALALQRLADALEAIEAGAGK